MIQTDYVLNEPECVPVRRGEIQAFMTFGILDQETFRLKMKEEFVHRNLLIANNITTGAALLHLLHQSRNVYWSKSSLRFIRAMDLMKLI